MGLIRAVIWRFVGPKAGPPPNPNGKNGKPVVVPLPFEDALKAALETPPEEPSSLDRKASKRYSRKKK
jgi:hypothetical protein